MVRGPTQRRVSTAEEAVGCLKSRLGFSCSPVPLPFSRGYDVKNFYKQTGFAQRIARSPRCLG